MTWHDSIRKSCSVWLLFWCWAISALALAYLIRSLNTIRYALMMKLFFQNGWSNWLRWCFVKAYFSDFVPTWKCMSMEHSDLISFLCVCCTYWCFLVADEGWSRPSQYSVFHPPGGERSFTNTCSGITDTRCVLLAWSITKLTGYRLFKEASWQIYDFWSN